LNRTELDVIAEALVLAASDVMEAKAA